MMKYKRYDTVEEMLAPETLSEILQTPVSYVRCLPYGGKTGHSNSQIQVVEIENGTKTRFILKRMSFATDWIMIASEDILCRSVTLWQSGVLDQLQPKIEHAIIACSQDGENGWALLMRDISVGLFKNIRAFNAATVHHFLDAMVILHATFWQNPELSNPKLGLCNNATMLQQLSPAAVSKWPNIASKIPAMLVEGWELLQEIVSDDVADTLRQLVEKPQILVNALSNYPTTLVHGSLRRDNLALLPTESPQPVFLDWQTAGYALATIDLAFFLDTTVVIQSPLSTEEIIAYYHQKLIAYLGREFEPDTWQAMLDLGRLANILRLGYFTALLDERDFIVNVYESQVRAAVKWL